jgi:hypothetical protein
MINRRQFLKASGLAGGGRPPGYAPTPRSTDSMIFTSLFLRPRSRLGRDKRREWVKELQAEPSRESFDDNSTGTAEGDTNEAVSLLQNQGIPFPLIAGFPVSENAPFRVVKVLVPTSKATFQCGC